MGNASPQASIVDIQGEILSVVRPLAARLDAFPKPIALCQLQLSEDDYADLRNWARIASPLKIDQWFSLPRRHEHFGYSPREAVGLMLLLLASEVGRREAQEGTLWSVVKAAFSPPLQERLFAQGHPRAEVKRAFEAAVERFSLHHAFGEDGTQAYYTTVFMQFGFTRRGLPQLAQWLANPSTQPTAVVRLRDESNEFAQLWAALKQGRHDFPSPFLPSEWRGELSQGEVRGWLDWPGLDDPSFRVNLKTVFPHLASGAYEIAEGGWLLVEGDQYDPEWLAIEAPTSKIQVALVDGESAQVSLWSEDEPIQAFTAEGRPCAARPGRALSLLLPKSIEPRPPAARWQNLGATGLRVHAFPEGLRPAHEFFENGNLLLTLESRGADTLAEELSLTLKDQLICLLPHTLEVHLHGGPELRSVHFRNQRLEIQGSKIKVTLDWDLEEPQLRLRCYFRGNYQRTVKHPLKMEVATHRVEGEWRRFEYLDELETQQAREGSYRFLLDGHRFGLVEGDIFQRRPLPGPLGQLAGYGAPLQLRHGPYGSQDQLPRTLARAVVDRGCFRAGHRSIELTPEHRFLHWDGSNPPQWSDDPEGALALAFRGARLGADWKNWQPPEKLNNPRQFAHLLRWLHFPLLQQLEILQPLFLQHPLEVLEAWLVDRFCVLGPERLELPESDAWLSVVGAYFHDWKPGGMATEIRIPVTTLLRADLLLAFRVARDGCTEAEKYELAKDLLKLDEIPKNSAGRLGQLRTGAAEEMKVAPEYLLTLVNQVAQPEWGDDLKIALRNNRFQEYVLAQLLLKHLLRD